MLFHVSRSTFHVSRSQVGKGGALPSHPETLDGPGQAFFQADFGGPAQIPLRSFGVESNLEDFSLLGGAVVWVLRIVGQFLEFPE